MPYPDNFSTAHYDLAWGRDPIELRAPNADELADIRTINDTIAVLEVARVAIRAKPALLHQVHMSPTDAAKELTWVINLLRESRQEIEHIPQKEADEETGLCAIVDELEGV